MIGNFFPGAPSAKTIVIRKLSTITRTKNVINCGIGMAKHQFNMTVNGPVTDNQLVKEVDLYGKTCLITGANSGLGLEMTRRLSARGCSVLMACRNAYAASHVAPAPPDAPSPPRTYELNLASLRSVTDCCNRILQQEKKIDIMILNAAVFGIPWTLTEDLLETTFQVNYFSQLYLLGKLESILAPDARVVFMSSESHRNVKWSVEDQMMPSEALVSLACDQYTSIKAYNISKLCCLLAMHQLAYRWAGSARAVFSVHPGSFIKTRLCRNWWLYEALYSLMIPFSKNISQAISTPIYCATSPDLAGTSGHYYKDLKICEESDLAQDFHLSFRLHDLYKELLAERLGTLEADKVEDSAANAPLENKVPATDTLTPEYSA